MAATVEQFLKDVIALGERAEIILRCLTKPELNLILDEEKSKPTLLSDSFTDDIDIEKIREISSQAEDKIVEKIFIDSVKECNNRIKEAAGHGFHACCCTFTWIKNKRPLSISVNEELIQTAKNKIIEKLFDYYQQRGLKVNITTYELQILW